MPMPHGFKAHLPRSPYPGLCPESDCRSGRRRRGRQFGAFVLAFRTPGLWFGHGALHHGIIAQPVSPAASGL